MRSAAISSQKKTVDIGSAELQGGCCCCSCEWEGVPPQPSRGPPREPSILRYFWWVYPTRVGFNERDPCTDIPHTSLTPTALSHTTDEQQPLNRPPKLSRNFRGAREGVTRCLAYLTEPAYVHVNLFIFYLRSVSLTPEGGCMDGGCTAIPFASCSGEKDAIKRYQGGARAREYDGSGAGERVCEHGRVGLCGAVTNRGNKRCCDVLIQFMWLTVLKNWCVVTREIYRFIHKPYVMCILLLLPLCACFALLRVSLCDRCTATSTLPPSRPSPGSGKEVVRTEPTPSTLLPAG
jgi:hypothetical protein